MEFIIRRVGKFLSIQFKHDGITIDIGLCNEKEQKEIALVLMDASTRLLEG